MRNPQSMKTGRPTTWVPRALWLALMSLFAACSLGGPDAQGERLGEAQSAVFTNGGFELGAANAAPQSWTVQTFLNTGITISTPLTRAGLNLAAGGVATTFTLASAGGPGSQQDMALGAAASLRWPRYGNQCAIVNGPNAAATSGNPNTNGANNNVNSLSMTRRGSISPPPTSRSLRRPGARPVRRRAGAPGPDGPQRQPAAVLLHPAHQRLARQRDPLRGLQLQRAARRRVAEPDQ